MIEDYSLIKSIGKGEFGEVYLASKKGINQLFAIKKVSKQKIESPSIKKYFTNEVTILKELQHKNIIRLETILQTAHNFYIITEFYNGGSLTDCLRKYRMIKGKPFTEEIVQHLMRQIIDALKYLHSKRIIHRDLKLDNMLINFESEEDKKNLNMLKTEVKIIDFGFATYLDNNGLRYSILGSPINMDPILLTKLINQNLSSLIGYNEKADIWSLGTVCYELITGKAIFRAQNLLDLVRLVEIGSYHIPTDLSQEIVSFLDSMLQYTSKYRLSAEELSNHPFLTKNVYEFTKLNLINFQNRIDNKGIVLNIKKNPDIEKPSFDVQARLNYCQQQQFYQNFKNNNNKIFPPAYNYYANTGPKYYQATTRPINQYQFNPQQAQNQGLLNQFQNQNTNLMRQNHTYQENNLQVKYNYKNNISKAKHNYVTNKYSNNHHINAHKIQKTKNITDTGEVNGFLPKGTRMPSKESFTNGFHSTNNDDNKYQYRAKNRINAFIQENNKQYNNKTNKPISKNFYSEFIQNPTGIPPISDVLNPSPIPYTEPIHINNPMYPSPIPFSGVDDENDFQPISNSRKKYSNHSMMNNTSYRGYLDNNYRNNESKKEISSDALDNLFDFNIGKELEPEPEVIIEK